MRVLVVSQYFWPESFRVNDIVQELTARGHHVTVLTGWPNYPDGQVFPDFCEAPGNFAYYAGAEILRIPILSRGKSRLRLLLNYLSFVASGLIVGPWRLRGRAFDTIFVFQTSPITSAIPALLLRWLKRAPLLIWVLDLWPETLLAVGVVGSPRLLGWIGRMVRFIYRRCDRILVQSRAFYANVEKYVGDTEKVRYFPAWAEPIFQGGVDAVAAAPEMAAFDGCFNIVFAGNIGDAQDFPAILDAAEALDDRPNVRWLIVGDGRSADWVRAEIVRRSLGDRVHLLGRFPLERMPSFFRGAQALLVSLRKDPIFSMTIPGKVQSYLAAGLPLLGMLDGEGARVIEDAGAGLICRAGEGSELAKQARALMDLPASERAGMGRRGADYCRREFDRDALLASLEGWMVELSSCVTADGDCTK